MSTEQATTPMTLEQFHSRYSESLGGDIVLTPEGEEQDTCNKDESVRDKVVIKQVKDAMKIRLSGHRRNQGCTKRGLWVAVHKKVKGVDHGTLMRHFDLAYAELLMWPAICCVNGAAEDGSEDIVSMREQDALDFERKQGRRQRAEHNQRGGKKPGTVRRGGGRRSRRSDWAA